MLRTAVPGAVAMLCLVPVHAAVIINGLTEELEANVLALMQLDDQDCEAPRRRVDVEFASARQDVVLALEAYGYYAPQVGSELSFAEDCWEAVFTVTPGEPVQLRQVDIQLQGAAQNDAAFASVIEQSMLLPGTPLLHARYDALKQALRSLALERGYRDSQFLAASVDVYPLELAADITLAFDSGERYRFGEFDIEDGLLDQSLLSRYINARSGDFYDTRRLANARLELINSGYFDDVTIEPGAPDTESLSIPVRIGLTPSARAQISYGFGLSTDTGPRFRFGRSIRRLNPSGHQLNVNGLFSPVVVEASANYRMPYGDPRSEWISFDVGGIREETDTSTSRSLQLGARRVVQQSALWTRTDLLSLLVEDFDIGSQSGRARLLTPGLEWTRLDADDAIRPDRGSRIQIDLRGADESLGSQTNFVQLTVAGKWIWSMGRANRLLVRAEAGRLWYDNFDELPPSIRYFAGGDHSVRGYDYETLGPTNEAGEVIGGSRLATASIEFERQVRPGWSVAVFSDAGNAFNGSSTDVRSSAGIGARWRSPLGPVRFDLAWPQDGPDRGVRLHITLGPDL